MKNGIAKEWTETFLAGLPKGMPELESVIKNSAVLNEKLAETAFNAAEDSVKLSAEWTKETFADLQKITKTQHEPAELTTNFAKYTSDTAGKSTQKMAALADIMGKMQAETIRLFVEASKNAMDVKSENQTPETAKPKVKKTPTASSS